MLTAAIKAKHVFGLETRNVKNTEDEINVLKKYKLRLVFETCLKN